MSFSLSLSRSMMIREEKRSPTSEGLYDAGLKERKCQWSGRVCVMVRSSALTQAVRGALPPPPPRFQKVERLIDDTQ